MNINVWSSFSKRRNSTKQPSGTGTTISVKLKENTSIEAPTFILNGVHTNYNYVQALGHYYFVDNIQIIDNSTCQLECSQDVLATYKTEIGNYTAFVERASSSYDGNVRDTMISATQTLDSTSKASTGISGYDTTGTYCLRIQGKGGIDQYVGSKDGIDGILYKAYDIDNFISQYNDITFDNVSGGMDQFRKILFLMGYDPSRFVVSLMWFPFSISYGSQNECYFGFYNIGPTSNAGKSSVQTITHSGTISMPARKFNDYRDYDNSWSRYSIYVPGCGETTLDASSLSKGLKYVLSVDVMTGNATVILTDNNGAHIATLSGTMGVSQQIGFASPQSALMNAISNQIQSSGTASGVTYGGISGKF